MVKVANIKVKKLVKKLSNSEILLLIIETTSKINDMRSVNRYIYREYRLAREARYKEKREIVREKRRFYNTMNYLKRIGYIKESINDGNKKYEFTLKGRRKLILAKLELAKKVVRKSKHPHLVIFDIPEKERRMRNLFRKCLYGLGYEMVQRSCFVGNKDGAYKFIQGMIRDCDLADFVEIFDLAK